jgi:hypothetical protein
VTAVFGKQSRYRGAATVVTTGAAGRVVAGIELRATPTVAATTVHTVDAGDRLDQLAATFYGQPLFYWRICDANPEFLSPFALLGQEPLVTASFPVTVPAGEPPWAALLDSLAGTVGVDDATVVEDVTLVSHPLKVGHDPVANLVERTAWSVLVRYNRVNLDAAAVGAVIEEAGFAVGPAVEAGQLGQRIQIPPTVGG